MHSLDAGFRKIKCAAADAAAWGRYAYAKLYNVFFTVQRLRDLPKENTTRVKEPVQRTAVNGVHMS